MMRGIGRGESKLRIFISLASSLKVTRDGLRPSTKGHISGQVVQLSLCVQGWEHPLAPSNGYQLLLAPRFALSFIIFPKPCSHLCQLPIYFLLH